jgi:UV DNA damage endonuclease
MSCLPTDEPIPIFGADSAQYLAPFPFSEFGDQSLAPQSAESDWCEIAFGPLERLHTLVTLMARMPREASPLMVGRCRLGLCCLFVGVAEVRFRTTTATILSKLPSAAAWHRLCALAEHNAKMLRLALGHCQRLGIRAFRVSSDLLPLATHEQFAYRLADLPVRTRYHLAAAGRFAAEHGIRLSFHPDQFVLLNSPRPEVVQAAIRDLVMHAELAEVLGADVINIHAGGAYGDKAEALRRLAHHIERLPVSIRRRLTLENDDHIYTVRDLLPICRSLQIPLVYDVHHHRCNPDDLSVERATELAWSTWDREPIFHISSPRGGWRSRDPTRHADYIQPADFPACWQRLPMTVDVEAKAKEKALLRLARAYQSGSEKLRSG